MSLSSFNKLYTEYYRKIVKEGLVRKTHRPKVKDEDEEVTININLNGSNGADVVDDSLDDEVIVTGGIGSVAASEGDDDSIEIEDSAPEQEQDDSAETDEDEDDDEEGEGFKPLDMTPFFGPAKKMMGNKPKQ